MFFDKLKLDKKHLVIFIIMLLSSIPSLIFLIAGNSAGLNYTFAPSNSADYITYLFKMRLGEEGHWLYTSYFVFEENPYTLMFTFYILIGHICRILHIDGLIIYLVVHIILSYLLLNKTYQIISLYQKNIKKSLWILFIISIFPTVLNEFEIFGVLRSFPHIILSVYLYFAIAYMFLRAFKENTEIKFWKVSLLLLVLAMIHPYMAIPLNILYILLLFKKYSIKKHIINLFIMNGIWVFYGFYLLYIFSQPTYEVWLQQSEIDSSSIIYFFILVFFGPVLLFALIYHFKEIDYSLKIWLLVYVICSILPLSFQRRMLEGFLSIILLVILLLIFDGKFKTKVERILKYYLVLSFGLGIYLVSYHTFSNNIQRDNLNIIYQSDYVLEVYDWFKENNIEGKNVFSDLEISSFLPAHTFNRVYAAHYAETYHFGDKLKRLVDIDKEEEYQSFIKELKIDYIVANKNPDKIEDTVKVFDYKFVEKLNYSSVFENEEFIIYEIK